MPIPPGTKFHGVSPSVDTKDRGSARSSADREAYPIEDFGASPFEYKADLPASGTLTFTENPSDEDTFTIGSTTVTFRSTLTGSGNEVEIQSSLNLTISRAVSVINNGWRFVENGDVNGDTIIPVFGVLNDDTITVSAIETGSSGNSIATTSTGSSFSWGAATLEGGTDGTSSVVSDGASIYIKGIATDRTSHCNIVYHVGWDPDTGLPLLSDNGADIPGQFEKFGSGSFSPFGIAVDPDANGSFNTIEKGDVFTACIFGVVENAYVYLLPGPDGSRRPEAGETLSVYDNYLSLGPYNGGGQPVATMLYPGTLTSAFATDAIVFWHGGVSSPYTRPTSDGVYPQNTVHIPGMLDVPDTLTAGTLLVHSGSVGDTEGKYAMYREYTSSDASLDIVGIATTSRIASPFSRMYAVCANGLVSNVPLYDAAGAIIPTTTTTIFGSVVYAGDGTVNPSHVLTTDSTSGVAIGIVTTTSLTGIVQPDTWTILFQPHRL